MQPFEFCRHEIAPKNSDWALSTGDLAVEKKAQLYGILSFASRVAEIPHRASEQSIAQVQIAWWKNQLLNAPQSDASIALHPSVACVIPLLSEHNAIRQSLIELVEHAESDIEFVGFHTREDWLHNWNRKIRPLWRTIFAVFSCAYDEKWLKVGQYIEWIQLLKQWPKFAHEGVIYVSGDVLKCYELDLETLTKPHRSPQFLAMLSEQSLQFRTPALMVLQALTREERRKFRPLLRWLHLQDAWLKKTESASYPLYHYRIELGLLQKKWICVRASL